MKKLLTLLAFPVVLLTMGCDNNRVQETRVEPDNTTVNERDADGSTATPFDQSNEQSDIDLVAKIRERVVAAPDMSIKGQNVKIITNKGSVILRGPVASATEKDQIEKIAVDVAGSGKVTNNLDVDHD